MSELINTNDNRATIRWKLLTGVSALALAAYISSAAAKAEDAGQPQIWIELGGQLNRLQDGEEKFAPDFLAQEPSIFPPALKLEKPPLYGLDENAAISFQPEGSSWKFSGSLRYGRSSSSRHAHHQTYPAYYVHYKYITGYGPLYISKVPPYAAKFIDTRVKQSETHAISGFRSWKRCRPGPLRSQCVIYAEFGRSHCAICIKIERELQREPGLAILSPTHTNKYNVVVPSFKGQPYHNYSAVLEASRSFHGIGSSISWTSSVPIAGNAQDSELSLDWGVNAAALFGRQRTKVHHQTTGQYHRYQSYRGVRTTLYQSPATPDHTRSRKITVPNIGGFAGLSFRYSDAKVSFGYKADFFFNAIDGGMDSRKSEDRGFHGPYASISIGLGD